MRFDDRQVASIVQRLQRAHQVRDASLRLRRALVFRRTDDLPAEQLGIHVPKPFDESRLVFQSLSGKLSDAAQFISATLSMNDPLIQVNAISTTDTALSARMAKAKERQEQALNGIYYDTQRMAKRNMQQIAAWGQVVDGVAWYVSTPRSASFGLPAREFYDELSDEEITELRDSGKAILDPTEADPKPKESADLWFARRKEASKRYALDGKTLFKTEIKPAGSIYVEWDGDALALGAIIEEVPSDRFRGGHDMAQLAARFLGNAAIAETGILLNTAGQIVAGIREGSAGADTDSTPDRFLLVRLFTRDEIYYYVSGIGHTGAGKIIWASTHNMSEVPFYPASGIETNSIRPDERYLALLDGEFAYTPLINQAATFITNIAAYEAFPRWVVETNTSDLVPDPENPGKPLVLEKKDVVGLDPNELAVIHGGRIKRLEGGDISGMMQILQFFMIQEAPVLPSEAETGAGGNSGSAWGQRLAQAAATKQYAPAVKSHARAVEGMARMQARTLRKLNERIFFVSAPGRRATAKGARALIEVHTKDFTDDLRVFQSPNTLEEQMMLRQVGTAQRKEGFLDDYRMVDEFFGVPDALDYVLDMYVQRVIDATLMGPNEQIPPGSLLFDLAQAARGHAIEQLLRHSPQFALAMAEANVARQGQAPGAAPGATGHQGGDDFQRGLGGQTSEAVGGRMPGVGMGVAQNALPAGPPVGIPQ